MSATDEDYLDEMIMTLIKVVEASGKRVRIASTKYLVPGNAIIRIVDHGAELWIRKGKPRASKG